MQFDQQSGGDRIPLPKPSIDTGMGLERISAVMQGVHDNYDTDTFKALIAASESLTGVKAEGDTQASHRVIADHLRSTSFLLADGVLPSNEGRGYVLRRIMRRAMRHAHLLGAKDPLMHRLVPALIAEMGQAYPELGRAQPLIEEMPQREEVQFRRTLTNGLRLLDEATQSLGEGRQPARRHRPALRHLRLPLRPDRGRAACPRHRRRQQGFDAAMAQQKAAARAAWKGSGDAAAGEVWFDIAEREGATEFTGYTATSGEGGVVALVKNGAEVDAAQAGDEVIVLTNQTPFYGESGGQSGDTGVISGGDGLKLTVSDTAKPLGRLHAHHAKVESGTIRTGDTVHLEADLERRDAIRANHSATHLLHAALRGRLGGHVTQKGSLVAADRLRFDFSHPAALTAGDIAAIEAEVNAEIRHNEPVTTRLMTPEDAINAGAMALFGEKYGDEVRVLSMGRTNWQDSGHNYSVELCGGTHVAATGDIGVFRVISESAVSSGVRRIEALTGEGARKWLVGREDALKGTASLLRTTPEDVEARVAALLDERRKMERELAEAKKALALGGGGAKAEAADEEVGGVKFSGQVIDGLDAKELRGLLDQEKQRMGSGVAAIVVVNEGKASIAAAVTEDLTGKVSAVDLVRAGVEALGGRGRRRPTRHGPGRRSRRRQGGRGDRGGEGGACRLMRAGLASRYARIASPRYCIGQGAAVLADRTFQQCANEPRNRRSDRSRGAVLRGSGAAHGRARQLRGLVQRNPCHRGYPRRQRLCPSLHRDFHWRAGRRAGRNPLRRLAWGNGTKLLDLSRR
nr:alanine--tRNA ligase [Novosphingobium sp. G106]